MVCVGGISADIVQPDNEENNVTDNIFSKIGVNLHQRESHPLGILKEKINEYFRDVVKEEFENVDDLEPVVSTEMNFDQVSGCVQEEVRV